jgi:hypothetical protein
MNRLTYVIILFLFLLSKSAFSSVQLKAFHVRYISIDTAISGGRIINPSGEQIIEAGICWSKTPQPSINDFKQVRSSNVDSFICVLRNLEPEQAYYVRAYAITSSGTFYSHQITFATDKLEFGAFMRGGSLFYVMQPGDPYYVAGEFHGLVLHEITRNTTLPWRNAVDTFITGLDTNLFSGPYNTERIVSFLGEGNYAAKACYDLVHLGFTDWYLPSQNELKLAYQRLVKFASSYAWSSSEYDKINAIQCTSIRVRNYIKTGKGRVYAIRRF